MDRLAVIRPLSAWVGLALSFGIVNAQEVARIDASSQWSFRSISPVRTGSSIVRLGDVVRPTDGTLPAWRRLRESPVGLVPVDGTAMTIDRDRLEKMMLRAEASPRRIRWSGPTEIRVRYDAKLKRNGPSASQRSQATSPTRTDDGVRPVGFRPTGPAPDNSTTATPVTPARVLSPVVAQRVRRQVEIAIRRSLPELIESHEVIIDDQPALAQLADCVATTSAQALAEVHDGDNLFRIEGKTRRGRVAADVTIRMRKHPLVPVPARMIPRGMRLSRNDFELRPISATSLGNGSISDLASLVGKESLTTLRMGRPVGLGDVGPPTLVRRGDQVELRVNGGGVTVTTNARALDNGALSDLIEVETDRPRKRIAARVAGPGVVEILTRPPTVPSSGGR